MTDPRMGFWDFILTLIFGPCKSECRGFKCIHHKGHRGNCHGVLVWDTPRKSRS